MTKLVASRFWNCEFCDFKSYEQKDVLDHLKKKHEIDVFSQNSNWGRAGDNIFVASYQCTATGNCIDKKIASHQNCAGCPRWSLAKPPAPNIEQRKLERHTHPDNTVVWEDACCIANFTGKHHIKDSMIFVEAVTKSHDTP